MSETTTNESVLEAVKKAVRAQLEPRPYPFPIPGIDGMPTTVMVQLLADGEIDDARIEAARYVTKRKVDLAIDPEFFDRETQRQIVWRSMLLPEQDEHGHRRLFPSDVDVRQLPSTAIEALHRLYLDHQDAVAPMQVVTDEQIEATVEVVKKGGSLVISTLDHPSLVRLVIALAGKLSASAT